MTKTATIAVIGGGAAGLTAAVFAARTQLDAGKHCRVLLLERNARVGKKLLATGNGHCNLTNTDLNISHFYSSDLETVNAVLSRFGPERIIDFFAGIGLLCHITDGGLVYPRGMQAGAVLDLLRAEAARLGVEELCDFSVNGIKPDEGRFSIMSDKAEIAADAVIVTTGSAAHSGSDSGFSLLHAFGHRIIRPYPALVPLVCDTTFIKTAAGMRAAGTATLIIDGKRLHSESGEIQFCSYGLSGIAVMQLSGTASQYFTGGRKDGVIIELDLMKEWNEEQLCQMLAERKDNLPYLSAEQFLCGLLNKRVGLAVMKASGIEGFNSSVSSLSNDDVLKICAALKHWRVAVTGTTGLANAQVCGGGAALDGFDADTLQSGLCTGLYAAGEVLDVYGDCGGYNLSWAWASGALAGTAAAQALMRDITGTV